MASVPTVKWVEEKGQTVEREPEGGVKLKTWSI